jgi:hypothetical protein
MCSTIDAGQHAIGESRVECSRKVVEGRDQVASIEAHGRSWRRVRMIRWTVQEGGCQVGTLTGNADRDRHLLPTSCRGESLPRPDNVLG